ncbi:hypothetical protein I2H38_20050 [Microvirga sp. BT350]|uniref:Uncharacterized protein n=1 Tax=Microvirga alba TaxID=2791025 RepID=A0A931BXI4_9HYPH|nr:hypothetical protein [Microvirga alba]
MWPYEEILARHIKDVVADLCLVEASIFVSYIYKNLQSNIDALVASSTELAFKEGTLYYAHGADMSFEWGKSPAVVLDMEFVHHLTTVFFKIVLHGFYVGIAIQRVLVSEKSGCEALDLETFARALSDARLSPVG